MLKEAIEFIREMADDSRSAEVVSVPGVKDKTLLINPDGEPVWVDHALPDREHNYRLPSDWITAVNELAESDDASGTRCYVDSLTEVRAIIDHDERRRNTVSLLLPPHPIFNWVQNLCAKRERSYEPPALVRLLRTTLKEHVSSDLAGQLARVKITQTGIRSSESQVGRERGTQEFDAELDPSHQIPEMFTITFPMYLCPGLPVDCSLRVHLLANVQNFSFDLIPYEGDYESMILETQIRVRDMLADQLSVPIGVGSV